MKQFLMQYPLATAWTVTCLLCSETSVLWSFLSFCLVLWLVFVCIHFFLCGALTLLCTTEPSLHIILFWSLTSKSNDCFLFSTFLKDVALLFWRQIWNFPRILCHMLDITYSLFTFIDFPHSSANVPVKNLILYSLKTYSLERFIRIDRKPLFEEDSRKLNG